MRKFLVHIVPILCLFTLSAPSLRAQFREEAFSQTYSDGSTDQKDSIDTMFSLKEYFGGVTHKREARIGTLFAGSTIFVGGFQAYNKDYWKLPIIYGALGTTIGLGFHYRESNPELSKAMFFGTGAVWWASLFDGAANFKKGEYPQSGKATIYSILFPGLGQAYNGEYWKIPVYWTGIIGSYTFLQNNSKNYNRFRKIYSDASEPGYTGQISAQTAQYYRNYYRRMRDYSYLATAGFYLLQVIDAYVFAFMHDFNMDDDLVVKVSPAVVTTGQTYAMKPQSYGYGLQIGLSF